MRSKAQLILEIKTIVAHYERRRDQKLSLLEQLKKILEAGTVRTSREILASLEHLDLKIIRHHHSALKRTLAPPRCGRPPIPWSEGDFDLWWGVRKVIAERGLSVPQACNVVAADMGLRTDTPEAVLKRYQRANAKRLRLQLTAQ
jgi:hypothetical protein